MRSRPMDYTLDPAPCSNGQPGKNPDKANTSPKAARRKDYSTVMTADSLVYFIDRQLEIFKAPRQRVDIVPVGGRIAVQIC